MNKVGKYYLAFAMIAFLIATATGSPSAVFADEVTPLPPPSVHPGMPQCANMPEAQVSGTNPGSACQISLSSSSRVLPLGQIQPMLSHGRTGTTDMYTSTTDSGVIENEIKVEGYLWMWWPIPKLWQLEDDPCRISSTNASFAACRTYGGTPGYQMGQQGYHYWINSTYGNDSLQTWDSWFF